MRLQQAGRLGMELHQQNTRLRRGIQHLEHEHELNFSIGKTGMGTDAAAYDTNQTTAHHDRVEANAAAIHLRSQNTVLHARNQNLNVHCEEADARIEDLMQQVHQLEGALRKERLAAVARSKIQETATDSQTSSPRTPRTTSTPSTPSTPLRLHLESVTSTSTMTSPRMTGHNPTLEERVESFLEANQAIIQTTKTTTSSSTRTTAAPHTLHTHSTPSTPSTPSTATRLSSIVHASRATQEMATLQSTVNDMRLDVVSLQDELHIAQEETHFERRLRSKLDLEVQEYHRASQRQTDETELLGQRMRLAELARQSAESRTRKMEVKLRNVLLENTGKRERHTQEVSAAHERQIYALNEEKVAAEERARSFQKQAVETLKQLMEIHREKERMEQVKVKKVQEARVVLQVQEVGELGAVRCVSPGSLAPVAAVASTVVASPSSLAPDRYSMKLKRLQDLYNKAGMEKERRRVTLLMQSGFE